MASLYSFPSIKERVIDGAHVRKWRLSVRADAPRHHTCRESVRDMVTRARKRSKFFGNEEPGRDPRLQPFFTSRHRVFYNFQDVWGCYVETSGKVVFMKQNALVKIRSK